MLENMRDRYNTSISIISYDDRKQALKHAGYVINAIQVGGYKPATVIDFDIPKRYGLRQTIADTVGIGGISVPFAPSPFI